jgi:hypothetical protein
LGYSIFGGSIGQLLAFPFQRLIVETPLPVMDVIKRIEQAVEPRKLWRWSRVHRDFQGVTSHNAFKITRIIHYRNSFLPVIVGAIKPRLAGGTRVEITMRLAWAVAAFMILWSAVPLGILVFMLASKSGAAPQKAGGLLGFTLMMACFAYALCSGGFNVEARRAREILVKVISGEQA